MRDARRFVYGVIEITSIDGIGKTVIYTLCNNKGLNNKYRLRIPISGTMSGTVLRSNKNNSEFTASEIGRELTAIADICNNDDVAVGDKYIYAYITKTGSTPQYKKIISGGVK